MFLEDESTLKPPKLFIGKKTRGKGAKCEGKKVKKKQCASVRLSIYARLYFRLLLLIEIFSRPRLKSIKT